MLIRSEGELIAMVWGNDMGRLAADLRLESIGHARMIRLRGSIPIKRIQFAVEAANAFGHHVTTDFIVALKANRLAERISSVKVT